jgi:hypothetical protein
VANRTVDRDGAKSTPRSAGSAAGRSYEDATGERIEDTLDIHNWDPAHRMAEQFDRLQGEIIAAQVREMEARRDIREQAFPLIASRDGAPRDAGVHEVELGELRTVQQHLLFSGHVQAVDGASVVHQTLPMTIFQTAIALATYLGDHGTWGHRVFQKDVKVSGRTALDRTLALLAQRKAAEDADDAGVPESATGLVPQSTHWLARGWAVERPPQSLGPLEAGLFRYRGRIGRPLYRRRTMASKISSIEAIGNEVAAGGLQIKEANPARTRGAKAGARQKQGPVEQKTKEAKSASRSEPASKSPPPTNSKSDLILKKLRTTKGASIETLMAATGWQAHSVRGFLSAVVKKKMALNLVSDIGKDGVRRYRIDGDMKSA